jgi:hypothetical protein
MTAEQESREAKQEQDESRHEARFLAYLVREVKLLRADGLLAKHSKIEEPWRGGSAFHHLWSPQQPVIEFPGMTLRSAYVSCLFAPPIFEWMPDARTTLGRRPPATWHHNSWSR